MGVAPSECMAERSNLETEHRMPPVAEAEALPVWDPKRAGAGECGSCARGWQCDIGEECLVAYNLSTDALDDKECADVLLVQASTRGDLEDVERALARGASVDTVAELALNMGVRDHRRIKRVTPLMRACDLGHGDVVKDLLRARADPWKFDSRKWTPLCYALGAGEFDIARDLLLKAKGAAEHHKAVVERLQLAIIEQCEVSVGDEAAQELRKALGPGGFLAKERKV